MRALCFKVNWYFSYVAFAARDGGAVGCLDAVLLFILCLSIIFSHCYKHFFSILNTIFLVSVMLGILCFKLQWQIATN